MHPSIRVERLSKRYRLGARRRGYATLRETLAGAAAAPWKALGGAGRDGAGAATTLWALDDVSFAIEPGQVVGVIGRNGAGKSTLLKILSRITDPTAGRVELRGRIASLLEVGTGFHHELTGRENVFLNGAILGMSRREIVRKFDAIVAFAEVERFLDTPVKHYSSGMYVRLAFAVAAHLESEILVVDEVLAVGDAKFQRRCLDKMGDISRSGRTVLFVSHNLGSIRALCRDAITLEQGRLIGMGPADTQLSDYLARLAAQSQQPLETRDDREGGVRARVTQLRFVDASGQEVDRAFSGDPLSIIVGYRTAAVGANVEVGLSCWSAEGQKLFHVDNRSRGRELPRLRASGEFTCDFPKLPLPPGRYHLNVMLRVDGELADHIYSAAVLEMLPGDFYNCGATTPAAGSLVYVDHDWNAPA